MVCSLLGVQLPCCGESKVVLSEYTELRMLFEAVFEGLPSALVSTAVLYDKLGLQSEVNTIPTAVLCLSLASSFLRGAVEIWSLAVLTHARGNCCFMTSIADMVWDMLPDAPPCQSAQRRPAQPVQCPAQPEAASVESACATAVTIAPVPMSVQQHSTRSNAGAQGGKPPDPAVSSRKGFAWVLMWVWFWLSFFAVTSVLLFISIGCVGLLVEDGYISLRVLALPKYQFAGDAGCGAGSLFAALHGVSCTLPNLLAV
jgi:hypothetical protein